MTCSNILGLSIGGRETPLEVVVGAILTQNVAWNNVERRLITSRERLVIGSRSGTSAEEELAELIIPTRYYNQKATRLKGFMIMVEENLAVKWTSYWPWRR